MHARVTLLEIDVMRVGVEDAVAMFRSEVLPGLRTEPGFQGILVLSTPEGKAMLVSLWDTAEHAEVGASAGFYAETLERYLTIFRSPPGRERYEVEVAELPVGMRT